MSHSATTQPLIPNDGTLAANHERKDTTMNDRLLTIAEVSEMLRGPIATLRWWRHIGEGPRSFKIGRRVFYRESDVLAWIELQAARGCGDGTAASYRAQQHEQQLSRWLRRKGRCMASIEKRTPKGRTRWYTRYRDPSGTQRTRTFDRKVDAQRHLTSVESAKQAGVYIDPSRAKVTMGEWSERWLAGTAHLKPSTRERYEGILRAHILPRWRTTNLDSISHSAVQAWVTELSKELQPATVRKVHRVLSLILTLAVKDGRLVRNPATDINLPRVRSTEQRYLTHEQVHALARAAAAPDIPSKHRRIAERYTDQYRLIVLFLAYTGVAIR